MRRSTSCRLANQLGGRDGFTPPTKSEATTKLPNNTKYCMANLNRVLLIGNLTRDPEIRYTPKGTAIAEIGMAINRTLPTDEGGERREEVTYVDVTIWGRPAEVAPVPEGPPEGRSGSATLPAKSK